MTKSTIISLAAGLIAGACSSEAPTASSQAYKELPVHLSQALLHEDRSRQDRRKDAQRKPGETLIFAGLEDSMHILEMEAGKGYFTEILSRAVGEEGRITVVNPAELDRFFGDDLKKKISRLDLSNVSIDTNRFDRFSLPETPVDIAFWIQGPHEIWFEPSPGVSLGVPSKAFERVFASLKPGGVFLVIDHHAPIGSGFAAGGSLHRIDPNIILDHASAAGFILEERADFLENTEDQISRPSYDGRVRGNTSQFAMRFVKPS